MRWCAIIPAVICAVVLGGCRGSAPKAPGSAPPSTPPPPASTVPAVVRVNDGYLFGTYMNGKWVRGEDMWKQVVGGETYHLYTATRALGTAVGGKAEYNPDEPPAHAPSLEIAKPAGITDDETVYAIAGAWNALPRLPQALAPDSPVYQKAVRDILTEHHMARSVPANTTRVWRVDIEGDGTDEVLLAATSPSLAREMTFQAVKGDYSFVALRKVVGSTAKTVLLERYFGLGEGESEGSTGENRYTLDAVLDVNGDGVLEVVIGYGYHEGAGQTIHTVKGMATESVLWAGDDV